LFLLNFATEYLREKKTPLFSFPGDYFSYLCTDIGEGKREIKAAIRFYDRMCKFAHFVFP